MKICSIENCNGEYSAKGLCRKHYGAQYRADHKEERAKYSVKNKEKIAQLHAKYCATHKDDIAQYKAQYEATHKKERAQKKAQRMKTDIQYKLTYYLRNRLYTAIRNDQKGGSAVRDLGCTVAEFKAHIESLFEPWMTWENWGVKPTKEHPKVWHLDHILPLSSFDLTDREQFLEACHYTNLRPLESSENLRKSNHLF